MLEVLSTQQRLTNLPVQIESICTFRDRLYVGTKQDTLLVYEFKANDEIDLTLTLKSFSDTKKSINQISVLSVFGTSAQQLVCLSDGNVSIHSITMSTVSKVGMLCKGRAASLFTLHQSTASDEQESAQLAITCKRKLLLFHWLKPGLPQQLKEIYLYDVPKAMEFFGRGYSDSIFLGFKGKYCKLDVKTEQVTELICTTSRQLEAAMLRIDKDTIAICKDEWSLLLGEDGKPHQTGRVGDSAEKVEETRCNIKWSDCPTSLVYIKPYIAAVTNRGIEVKAKQLLDQIQLIDLPKARLVAQDTRTFVASTSNLWELQLSDLVVQVKKLISLKHFELAEILNKMSNQDDSTNPDYVARQREINTQAAFHEFIHKRYERSMQKFQKTNVEVHKVIGLFPELLSKKMQGTLEYPPEVMEAKQYLTPKDTEAGLEALEKYLVAKRFDLTQYEDEVETSKSTKIIIDTTLLKCYLQNKPIMVASLLRLKDNMCHITESERALKKLKRWNDVVILYKSKGLHEKALGLLKNYANMQQTQDHELGGPDHTIKYLQDLGPGDIDLIKEYSRWVIEKHPERSLDIFTDPLTVHNLPQHEIVDHLKSINPAIALQYLERLVDIFNISTEEIENTLITLLVEKVSAEWPDYQGKLAAGLLLPSPPGSEPGTLGELRRKLTHFLERLEKYTPSVVIKQLGFEIPLYQELAVLYGRQKEFKKSLMLYCHVLKDRDKAEMFCHKHFKVDNKIYFTLLSMYQCPPSLEALSLEKFKIQEPETDMETAIEILIKYYNNIDVKQALKLLPQDTKLFNVEDFLCAILKDMTSASRKNLVLKSLHLSDNLKVKSQKMFYQREKLIVTGMDNCAVCNKKVGECAIAFYPDRRIVHYGCMSRDDVSQPSSSNPN